jgi:hypothetical protein
MKRGTAMVNEWQSAGNDIIRIELKTGVYTDIKADTLERAQERPSWRINGEGYVYSRCRAKDFDGPTTIFFTADDTTNGELDIGWLLLAIAFVNGIVLFDLAAFGIVQIGFPRGHGTGVSPRCHSSRCHDITSPIDCVVSAGVGRSHRDCIGSRNGDIHRSSGIGGAEGIGRYHVR